MAGSGGSLSHKQKTGGGKGRGKRRRPGAARHGGPATGTESNDRAREACARNGYESTRGAVVQRSGQRPPSWSCVSLSLCLGW
ncbi:hypothetical protein TRIUR3_21599 [Triticum urartu]|uniref:Uncharacterized protein n=1 Tax=Triticum urartu TaxID=4572 RepID=M7YS55_TRIUA|nr:hypothetical protein TRIUR3_21599 [Triticum urartu]